MTIAATPMCLSCSRLREPPAIGELAEGLFCEAYPDGIPQGIILNSVDHRVAQPGDRGLRYDPQEGAEPQEWWPDGRGD